MILKRLNIKLLMSKSSLIAKKRIQRDIVEILSNPLEGISIAQIDQE